MSIFRKFFYKNRKFYDDDFDWENYTADSYHRRLKGDVESQYLTIAGPGDLTFDAASGNLVTASRPVHPNHGLILETIGRLQPASVHEAGCGGGDHVANAQLVFPDIPISGGDRGESQLKLAVQRHPELAGKLGVQDITMPYSTHWPEVDMVYSQAVVMHIHTAVSHFVALANMVRQARKYVLLVENQQCHNFVEDIRALHAGGHLAWDTMNIYLAEGSTGARAALLSREVLDMPRLDSDAQLRDGIKPSQRRLKRAADDSARALFGFGGF